MNTILRIAAIITLVLFISGCSNKIEWIGLEYKRDNISLPEIMQQTLLQTAPKFDSLSSCLNWGQKLVEGDSNSVFECSYGCGFDDEWKSIVCKDTTHVIYDIDKNKGLFQ